MKIYPSNALVLEYTSLPDDIKPQIKQWLGFGNDVLLQYSRRSEFSTRDLSMESLESYYEDQKETNDFTGTFEQFIIDYSLQFDKYLLDELPKRGIVLANYEELYIDIRW